MIRESTGVLTSASWAGAFEMILSSRTRRDTVSDDPSSCAEAPMSVSPVAPEDWISTSAPDESVRCCPAALDASTPPSLSTVIRPEPSPSRSAIRWLAPASPLPAGRITSPSSKSPVSAATSTDPPKASLRPAEIDTALPAPAEDVSPALSMTPPAVPPALDPVLKTNDPASCMAAAPIPTDTGPLAPSDPAAETMYTASLLLSDPAPNFRTPGPGRRRLLGCWARPEC